MIRKPVYYVDVLATEFTETGEIITADVTPPQTVLVPPPSRRIDTRGTHLFSSSTSGEVWAYLPTSNKILAKLYCTRYYNIQLPSVHIPGQVDEPIMITWDGLSVGAKIFYVIRYKLI